MLDGSEQVETAGQIADPSTIWINGPPNGFPFIESGVSRADHCRSELRVLGKVVPPTDSENHLVEFVEQCVEAVYARRDVNRQCPAGGRKAQVATAAGAETLEHVDETGMPVCCDLLNDGPQGGRTTDSTSPPCRADGRSP
jgi:hypothetical protein